MFASEFGAATQGIREGKRKRKGGERQGKGVERDQRGKVKEKGRGKGEEMDKKGVKMEGCFRNGAFHGVQGGEMTGAEPFMSV